MIKVKCPSCQSNEFKLVDSKNTGEGRIELRQCICFRRYKVLVTISGNERLK